MKKIAGIIAIILFLAPNVVHADDDEAIHADNDKIFAVKWSLVNFGFGMNSYQGRALNDDDPGGNWDLYFALGTIGVEHINTRIGIEFNPASWWAGNNFFISERNGWNFFNLNLYWNIVDYKIFQFGPFNRINYLYLTNEGIDWSKFTNTLGIRLQLSSVFDDFAYHVRWIAIEGGYKIKDGRSAFYLGLNVDVFVPVAGLFILYASNN
jgi:hypothetical protein